MKHIKNFISLMMILSICLTIFVMPVTANAETNEKVKIEFYKPDNWGDNINIHLWNAGDEDTQWPGVAMSPSGGNTYTYSSDTLTSCNFVINDGSNQTSDLYAEGFVGVKDNKVFKKCYGNININFNKPSYWSDDIKIYYYTNDSNEVSFADWPGVPMNINQTRDGYSYYINGLKDIRVLFTDGIHQYPAAGEPGIPVSAGQELLFVEDKYTVNNYNWVNVNQPTTYAVVGEDYHIYYNFTKGDDFSLKFEDEYGNIIKPTNHVYTMKNDKVYNDYTFNFSETGTKTIKAFYYYHSGYGDLNRDVKVKVLPQTNVSTPDKIFADKYNVELGDTFTISVSQCDKLSYHFYDDNGNEIPCDNFYYTNNDNGSYINYVFTANKLGEYQKFNCYSSHAYSPYSRINRENSVTINVWKTI